MGEAKSQFVLGGYNQGNYLLDSLAVAFEDTRKGFNPQTQTRIAAMAGYVAANPDKTKPEKFQGYVAKLQGAATAEQEAKPMAAQRSKPGTGML